MQKVVYNSPFLTKCEVNAILERTFTLGIFSEVSDSKMTTQTFVSYMTASIEIYVFAIDFNGNRIRSFYINHLHPKSVIFLPCIYLLNGL